MERLLIYQKRALLLIKNKIGSLITNKNIATIFFIALFFIIWQNPSEETMKKNAENYIINQNLNLTKNNVQEFLNQSYVVNNFLLFSTSSILYLDDKKFVGIGFLSYSKPKKIIYELFLKWEKPLLSNETLKASAAFIKINGDVSIKHFDKTLFNNAYLGESIYNKDSINIGQAPSFSAIQFNDTKSIVKIRENSTYELSYYDKVDEITLLNGVLINEINSANDRSFRVRTGVGIASVKGTVFAVKFDQTKGLAEFIGKTGSFEVQSTISGEVLVVNGMQKVTASKDGDFNLEATTSSEFPSDPTVETSFNNNYAIIRKYDFDKLNALLLKDKIETAITLFKTNVYEYPIIQSSITQKIEKGKKVNILPLFRDGFFVVSNNNGDPIGYIDEFDINFVSQKIKNDIKKYSLSTFLDSKALNQ